MKQLLRVIALVIFSSAFVHAQTVADLARKERARQQSNQTKTLVITNEKLKSGASGTQADAKPAEPPKPPLTIPGPTDSQTPGGHDEKWWRGQFATTREDIQRLEARVPVLDSNLRTANRDFLTRSYDPDGRGKKGIDEAKAALDQASSDLEKARQRIAQLEEELRRAGGPAGWAR